MAVNKGNYISLELQYLEDKIASMRKALDTYNLDDLQHEYGPKELPNGRVVNGIINSKNDQLKTVAFIMEKLPKMLSALDELREKEDKKKLATKGDVEMSFMMKED
jgi:hypothetical protein